MSGKKRVVTTDPEVTDYEYAEANEDPGGKLVQLTFELSNGDTVTISPGDELLDGDGVPVGTITSIQHHPDDDSGWSFTPYIDYSDEVVAETESMDPEREEHIGGIPLGEMAQQFQDGDLQMS